LKKVLVLALGILFFPKLFSQNAGRTAVPAHKVHSGSFGGKTITVFKRESEKIPFHVVVHENARVREFYVIRHVSDLFQYIMVEKTSERLKYYPYAWSDLESIAVSDVTARSEEIVMGKTDEVDRNDL
jgi:hypothetical protein